MCKLQIETAEVMRIAIQQEIARGDESRYDHRLHALLLVTAGQSCPEVAGLFGESGTTVQRCVSRFEQGGWRLCGVSAPAGRGRWRRRVGAGYRKSAKTPRDFDLAATLWDGPVLSEHLRRRSGVVLGVRQCQRLSRQMGCRLRKPRPPVAQSDPLKVAAVKKLRRLAPRRDVQLWSLNECRFQQHGSRCRKHQPASPWLVSAPSA